MPLSINMPSTENEKCSMKEHMDKYLAMLNDLWLLGGGGGRGRGRGRGEGGEGGEGGVNSCLSQTVA